MMSKDLFFHQVASILFQLALSCFLSSIIALKLIYTLVKYLFSIKSSNKCQIIELIIFMKNNRNTRTLTHLLIHTKANHINFIKIPTNSKNPQKNPKTYISKLFLWQNQKFNPPLHYKLYQASNSKKNWWYWTMYY